MPCKLIFQDFNTFSLHISQVNKKINFICENTLG